MTTGAMADPQLERRQALRGPLAIYERMVEIRLAEERIQLLYEQGHLRGSTHLCIGQEAVCVGVARAARVTDTVSCTYRGHGMAMALGVEPEAVFGEVTGRVIGCAGGLGGSMHLSGERVGLLPTFAIVGAGLPVAAGAALAAQVKGSGAAAIAVFGDGSANIGAFHETLNLASIWKLPVVFVCENNLYGEYTRIQLTTPVEDSRPSGRRLRHAWGGRRRPGRRCRDRGGGRGPRARPPGRRPEPVGNEDLPVQRPFPFRRRHLSPRRRARRVETA